MPRLDDPRATILNQPETDVPGTVAILAGATGRYTYFWICALQAGFQLPIGTGIRVFQGTDIAESRNQAAAELLEGDSQWLWFIDDDHAFRPDIVKTLLARNVDLVTPLCLRRQSPFLPVATSLDGDFLRLADLGHEDLVSVMFAGTSGMLIRRRVLERIEEPWFELRNGMSEDVTFCKKAVEAGFEIHVDLAVPLGHTTTATVWPKWDDARGEWMTGFTIADGAEIMMGTVNPREYTAVE